MSNPIVPLPSGAKLELQDPPFRLGTRFYRTLAAEIKSVPVSFKLSDFGKLEAFKDRQVTDINLGDFKNVFLQVIESQKIEDLIFELLASGCLYDGEKITPDTFEPIQARGDWFPAAWEVGKHALVPFLPSLISSLSELLADQKKSDQKSESPPPPSS